MVNETVLCRNRSIADDKGIRSLLLIKGIALIFFVFILLNEINLILAPFKTVYAYDLSELSVAPP